MFKYTRVMYIVYTDEHNETYLNVIIGDIQWKRLGMIVENGQEQHVLNRH
jgi:hypothetical protein